MPGITFQLMERKRGSVVKIKHHGLFLLLGPYPWNSGLSKLKIEDQLKFAEQGTREK